MLPNLNHFLRVIDYLLKKDECGKLADEVLAHIHHGYFCGFIYDSWIVHHLRYHLLLVEYSSQLRSR